MSSTERTAGAAGSEDIKALSGRAGCGKAGLSRRKGHDVQKEVKGRGFRPQR